MTALQFATEFVNDLLQTDTGLNLTESKFVFNKNTYQDDPELKILKQKLQENGFNLKLVNKTKICQNQEWQVIKL